VSADMNGEGFPHRPRQSQRKCGISVLRGSGTGKIHLENAEYTTVRVPPSHSRRRHEFADAPDVLTANSASKHISVFAAEISIYLKANPI